MFGRAALCCRLAFCLVQWQSVLGWRRRERLSIVQIPEHERRRAKEGSHLPAERCTLPVKGRQEAVQCRVGSIVWRPRKKTQEGEGGHTVWTVAVAGFVDGIRSGTVWPVRPGRLLPCGRSWKTVTACQESVFVALGRVGRGRRLAACLSGCLWLRCALCRCRRQEYPDVRRLFCSDR